MNDIAVTLLQLRKWEALPWDAANNGAYPLKPTQTEIDVELRELARVAEQGLAVEMGLEDHIRWIALKECARGIRVVL